MTNSALSKKRIISNSSLITVRSVVLIAQGILLIPLLTSFFPLEIVGVWFLITQMSAHLQLLEFGIPTSLTRLISHYQALNNDEKASCVITICLVILSLVMLLIIAFSSQIVSFFSELFLSEFAAVGDISTAVLIAVLSTAVLIPLRLGLSLLEAKHYFYIHCSIEVVSVITRITLLYGVFYFYEANIILLSSIYFSTTIGMTLTQFYFGFKKNRLPLTINFNDYTLYRKIFSVGFAAVLVSASAVILRQGSPMILALFESASDVAILSIALLVVTSLIPFVTIPCALIAPQSSQCAAKGELVELYDLFILYCKYSLLIGVIGNTVIFYVGLEGISLWLSDNANISDDQILKIYTIISMLFLAFTISLPALIARTVLVSTGKHIVTSLFEIITILIGVSVGICLVYFYDMSAYGMAVGVAVAFIFRGFGPVVILFVKQFEINLRRYLLDVYGKMFLLCMVILAFSQLLEVILPEGLAIVKMLVVLFILTVFYWLCMVDVKHKKLLIDKIRRA